VRVYSPTKQIVDQDPDCIFIKKWIPELRAFSPEQIVSHETLVLGTYVAPIVDFKTASKRMKDQVFQIKKSQEGRLESQKVLTKHGSRKTTKRPRKKKEDDQQEQLSLFE